MIRVISAAALVSLAAHALAAPPPPPHGPLPDWPCNTETRETLTVAGVLSRSVATPSPSEGAWRTDPVVKAAADFAAAPENAPQFGAERLAALAAAAGPHKDRMLLEALDGIVTQTNTLRGIIIDGIGDKVVKSRLLAERLASVEHDLAALPADATPQQRGALTQARESMLRALGDNADDAELLCHRLGYTRHKAERLAAAIAEQLGH